MTQQQIHTAFENRWRIYGQDHPEQKDLCRNFFEAGIAIAEAEMPIYPIDPITTPTTFDAFWSLYDKKVARPKCEKLWGRLTLSEQAACMAYIPLYKQAQPDKQYRKNPETFLRNKSWNDEIISTNSQEHQRAQRIQASATIVAKYTGTTVGDTP